jgi:hypothetical protein
MRHIWFSLLVLFSAGVCDTLLGQSVLAPSTSRPDPQINLGEPVVALKGPWKFHTGDDLAWASSSFDDSTWGAMDLTPPPGSYDPAFGSRGYVPGWTVRGYAGYSGFAWYRLRVDLQNEQTALKLKMPNDFDDAYQVFIDGQLVGQFGRFTGQKVTVYNALPRAFSLPASLRRGPLTVAVRMWMTSFTPLVDPDAGGLHGPPVLGKASEIDELINLDWDTIDHSNASAFFHMKILVLALMVAFGLFWLDRKEPAYFWLGLTCTVSLARTCAFLAADYGTWIPANINFLLNDAILAPMIIGLWVLFWAYWFRLNRIARLQWVIWGLVVLLGLGMAMLRTSLYGSVVPVEAIVWLSPLTLVLKLLLVALLAWVTYRGIRQNKTEGWLALPAVLLVATVPYLTELIVLHVPTQLFIFGTGVSIGQIGSMLSLSIITLLLLRRFLRSQRERELWKLDLEQARQVQQMLIPTALPVVPGLTIESEYRPARVVGGDFFQIIPHSTDGSVLVVVGDVTGKGLQAGMLVALIIGAIRAEAAHSSDSLTTLTALNQRLCGRGEAHATGLALRIAADGAVTMANAGHLPPYLNGRELPMEGALPLGILAGAEFSIMRFQLAPGDRLILLSDGIAEAQNEKGQLFGFERIHAMLRRPIGTAEIATAAQEFGQTDDISVLSVTRTAIHTRAMA